MIKLYKNEWLPVECQNYFVELDEEGNQTMQFDIPLNDTYYHITPECLIQDDYNQWLVKSINQLKSFATIVCGLDMDDWYSKYYLRSADDAKLQTKTLSDALNYIKPTGWTISNAGIRTIKRTLDLEKCTAYDLLMRAKVVYDIQYDIDTINKVITVVDPNTVIDKGVYVTPELNMKSTNYKGESKSIVTRLYCYGADDITFESINNGKPYVENTSYKGKPICASWTDGRYTNIESLLEDGKKKLAEMSVPTGAYTIDVVDLQAIDDRYKNLDMQLRSTVHCIVDPERKIDIIHRIVKKRIYPDEPSQNKITLSNQPRTLDKEWNALKENIQTVRKDGFRHETEIRQTNTEITEVAKKTDENTKGIKSVEEKITPEQLLVTVSDSINDGNKLNTMKFVVDINGIKVKNGGIEVYDASNNLVLYVDEKTKKLVFNGLITASEININDKFKVSKEGKMIGEEVEIKGDIKGGNITGDTTINVGTDLYVGDNIYLNQIVNSIKKIVFNSGNQITSTWFDDDHAVNYLSLISDGGAGISADCGKGRGSVSVSSGKDSGKILATMSAQNSPLQKGGYYSGATVHSDGYILLDIMNQKENRMYQTGIKIQMQNDNTGIILPLVNNNMLLGTSYNRWNTVYAVNSFNSSDMKEKNIIEDYHLNALNFINAMEPIAYHRIADGDSGKRIHIGLGAQTLAETIKSLNLGNMSMVQASYKDGRPYYGESVSDDDLNWSINYIEIIPILIKAIQELQQKLKEGAI